MRELLEGCLRSIEPGVSDEQIGRGQLEIIVVDNGSTDGSREMLRERFPGVVLIESSENLGFGRANNAGVLRSTSEALLLLNPDTIVQSGAIEELRRFLANHREVGMVAPRLLNPDGTLQRNAFRFPGLLQTFLDLFPLHPRLMDSPLNGRYRQEREAQKPFRIEYPLGAAMLLRRKAYEQVGGFDERFFMYAEEVDLALRITRAGWQIWQVPAARITHYGGQSTGQVRARMLVELWRARRKLYRFHYSRPFRLAADLIIRAGMLRKIALSYMDERRGRLSRVAARELRRAYGTILRLL